MFEVIARENIYDQNGELLLAKGERLTDEVVANLKEIQSPEAEDLFDPDILKSYAISSVARSLGEKMNIRNERVLGYAQKILRAILYESKAQPWRVFFDALSEYVDWLFTHSVNVAVISLMIAMEKGYDVGKLLNLGLGAFLHDVGKLSVPKSVIQKPGALNKTEMACIRKHCVLGVSSLEKCSMPRECLNIVLQHHERLDGSGYPQGLKNDEICENAQIVMIADVVDAITSYRPYKQLQKTDTALKILRKDQEKYSQELVSVLEKLLR